MLAEETKLKMAATNKQKQLGDEVEHLKFQLEEEEDSKQQLQNRLLQLTQQVLSTFQFKHSLILSTSILITRQVMQESNFMFSSFKLFCFVSLKPIFRFLMYLY